ncbi:hypothetical protein XENOCAPTIV_018384 [Xenoophorus captivus]|uniref:Uncharacterized protein n=1 Tax=Xenoophorus captivus TaxID=1517983 RepID=A0ABV0R255_9TELE
MRWLILSNNMSLVRTFMEINRFELENQNFLLHWGQQLLHMPHEALGHPRRALERDTMFYIEQFSYSASVFPCATGVSVRVNLKTHSYQRDPFWDCHVPWPLYVHLFPVLVVPGFPDSVCLRTGAPRSPCCLVADHQHRGNHLSKTKST